MTSKRCIRTITWLVATAVTTQAHGLGADEVNGSWTRVVPPGVGAPNRSEHAAVYDHGDRRMLVFGGFQRQDLWEYDLAGGEGWSQVVPGGPQPSTPRSATAILDVVRDRLVVLMGDNNLAQGETWAIDLAGPPTWQPLGSLPVNRLLPCIVYDAGRDRVVIHGGLSANGVSAEVWLLTLDNGAWTQITTTGTPPSARWAHAGVYDPLGDRMIFFSGREGYDTDVWALSFGATTSWSRITPVGAAPSGRGHAAVTYDPVLKRMILHGGFNGAVRLNDTWALNLDGIPTWQLLNPTGSAPPANSHRTAVYDAALSRVVLFGGFEAPIDPGEVWLLRFGPSYPVTITIQGGGTVSRSPDQSTYDQGSTVRLTAVPAAGWHFAGWSGEASGNANPLDLVVDEAKQVVATFEANLYTLDVTLVGSGSVTRTPDEPYYGHGEQVTLRARPSAGWVFAGWGGDTTATDTLITLTMTGDASLTATFEDHEAPTTRLVYPNGGEILVTGSDYKVVWEATDSDVVAEVDIDLSRDDGAAWEPLATAVANAGTIVLPVTGPGTNTSSTPVYTARLRITARDVFGNTTSDASDAPFAIYDLNPDHVLTLQQVGDGTLTRDPDRTRYAHGAHIVLTADAAPGWEFVGWSGDTSYGASPFEIVLDRNKTVVGTFRDVVAPTTSVVYPNGGQILVPGSTYMLAWNAADNDTIPRVNLSISRDEGGSWEPIATAVPNTGHHAWVASRPGNNPAGAPEFHSLLRVEVFDAWDNTALDQSDAPFAIHDLAPAAVDAPITADGLHSIEPNPAAISATIAFALVEPSAVRLTVHDLQGRRVAMLADGHRPAGLHRAEWAPCRASDCAPPGVYFVRYETARGVHTRRLLVAR